MLLIVAGSAIAYTREETAQITDQQILDNIRGSVSLQDIVVYPEGVDFFFNINSLEQINTETFRIRPVMLNAYLSREHWDICVDNYGNCWTRLVNNKDIINYTNGDNETVMIKPIMYQLEEMAKSVYRESKETRDEAQNNLFETQGEVIIDIDIE